MVLGDVKQHMLLIAESGPYGEREWGGAGKVSRGRSRTSCVALEIIAVVHRCKPAFPIHESEGGNLKMNIWDCGEDPGSFRIRRFGLVKVSWTKNKLLQAASRFGSHGAL